MGLFRLCLGRGGHRAERPRLRPRNHSVEVTLLEDRRLPTVSLINSTANPVLLFPPNGRYVPVEVSGHVDQVITYNLPRYETTPPTARQMVTINTAFAKQPFPATSIQVTDQYREDEPSVNVPLTETSTHSFFNPSTPSNPQAVAGLIRNFTYTKTIYLRAKLGPYSDGRQYTVDVYAADSAGGIASNSFVFVPRHATRNALQATPHQTHPNHLKGRSY